MERSEVINLSPGHDLDQLVHQFIMTNQDASIPKYSNDPNYIIEILDHLKAKGIHVDIKSIIEGYRISWGGEYDEVYTSNILEGICKIGLIATLNL